MFEKIIFPQSGKYFNFLFYFNACCSIKKVFPSPALVEVTIKVEGSFFTIFSVFYAAFF